MSSAGIFEERIHHYLSFSEFSMTQGDKFEKNLEGAMHFHPGYLQPKTRIFTLRESVE